MNEEWLREKYETEKLSMAAIAILANCSTPTIQNHLRKFSIPTRSVAQALTGRKLSEYHKAKVLINITQANQKKHLNGVTEEEKTRLAAIRPSRTGQTHSEDTKTKISKSHLGKVMSENSRKRMSEARMGRYSGKKHPLYGQSRKDMKGEKNPNWNGGTTALNKQIRASIPYKQWRQSCFERDGYICQFCGQKGGSLQVDHITTYASLIARNEIKTIEMATNCQELWNVGNGRTLCVDCHKKTETYGRPKKECEVKEK